MWFASVQGRFGAMISSMMLPVMQALQRCAVVPCGCSCCKGTPRFILGRGHCCILYSLLGLVYIVNLPVRPPKHAPGVYFSFLLSAAAAAPCRELSWLSLTIAPFARWLCTLFRQCQQTVESPVCIPGHNLSVHHGAPQIGCCISTCFLHTGQNRTHKTGRWIGSCR